MQDFNSTPEFSNIGERPAGAVILGGAHGSLAVARSLGRRGVPVWFVTNDHPIAKYSRYVPRSFDWPGPQDEQAASAWLMELARRYGLDDWTLFAGGDEEVRLVAHHHATLDRVFRLTTPRWKTAQFACDKRLTYQHASNVRVDCPLSLYPRDRREVATAPLRFPIILKPSYRMSRNAFTNAKAWRADDRESLLARYDEAVPLVGNDAIVLQELIPGAGEAQFSYAGVWDKGAPVASFVVRRSRQYPIDFGFTSTFVETVDQPEIKDAAHRFLASLHFSGLVEVEFKYDHRDRKYKLLDVNPRPWTWIGLGEAAGVDLPWIQWALSRGEPAPASKPYASAAWAHASRDAIAAAQLVAHKSLRVKKYLGSWGQIRTWAAFATDDPLPGVMDLPVVAARVLKRRFSRTTTAQLMSFVRRAGFPAQSGAASFDAVSGMARAKTAKAASATTPSETKAAE
jgi:D-aspartate ligase